MDVAVYSEGEIGAMTQAEFQEKLEEMYSRIQWVNARTGNKKWADVVPTLRTWEIRPVPNWWKWILKTIGKIFVHEIDLGDTAATTMSLPALSNAIYLFPLFWEQPIRKRCALLVHEYTHIVQYREGRLNKGKYISNQSYRTQIEDEAYTEQGKFDYAYAGVYGEKK